MAPSTCKRLCRRGCLDSTGMPVLSKGPDCVHHSTGGSSMQAHRGAHLGREPGPVIYPSASLPLGAPGFYKPFTFQCSTSTAHNEQREPAMSGVNQASVPIDSESFGADEIETILNAIGLFHAEGVPGQPQALGATMASDVTTNTSEVPQSKPCKPRATYIPNDKKRGKAHSERCARILEALHWLQVACRPYIFLFVARPETILSSNGRVLTYASPALKAVLEENSRDLGSELHCMTREYAQRQRLITRDIDALHMRISHTESENAQELAAERAKTAAVEAEVARLKHLLGSLITGN